MKKTALFFGAFLTLFLISCEGPAGPPGPPGFDGLDGADGLDGIQGQVFEIDGINFDYDGASNLYTALITYTDFTDFEVFESDAVLVYRFDGTIEFQDGSTADAWSQIPQNFFLPEGTMQYTFAHTFIDLELFIDGNFDLSLLSTDFTDNQSFRFVIVPSVFLQSKVDKGNISAVMSAFGLEEKDVKHLSMQ